MDIGPINFGGLASGIDTAALVQAILNAERQPAVRLEAQQSVLQSRVSALADLDAKLSAFSDALHALSADITFRGRTATVTEDGFYKATSGAGADTGIFAVEVLALAAAHKVKSAGVVAADQSLVTDGTITIQSGGNDAITVNVSTATGNNSLQAIRDAINTADQGVSASVVFDGTSHTLVVRATETGTGHALTISDTTNLNLDDTGALVTEAADAQIVVDGIAITSASNHVTGVLAGTTLDLLAETDGAAVNVEVATDTTSVVEAVESLVDAYNTVADFLKAQFDLDAPGPLSGDSTARQVQQDLMSVMTSGVAGIPVGGLRSLSSVGVSFDNTGRATLSTSKLEELLTERFDEVADLFLNAGTATDLRISYTSAASGTVPGSYDVTVTQAAAQASVAGSGAISALAADETLTIAIGSTSANVALTAGMTTDQVVAAINAALHTEGVSATARNDGGSLRITSSAYGSATTLSVTSDLADSGNGTSTGFGTTATTASGLDVAGTIGGVAATGNGQFLTGGEGGGFTGLTIKVTASAADVVATGGNFGSISFSRGLVSGLLAKVDGLTRPIDGPIAAATEALNSTIDRIEDDITRIEERLLAREAFLVRMFSQAEQAIATLQAQQAQLANGGF
jgi:flagellar hook-associated protein 2